MIIFATKKKITVSKTSSLIFNVYFTINYYILLLVKNIYYFLLYIYDDNNNKTNKWSI